MSEEMNITEQNDAEAGAALPAKKTRAKKAAAAVEPEAVEAIEAVAV